MVNSVIIRELAQPSNPPGGAGAVSKIYLFATSSNSNPAEINTPIKLDKDNYLSEDYDLATVVISSIEGISRNSPRAEIYIIYCKKEGGGSILDNLTEGLNQVQLDDSLEAGYILIPEHETLLSAGDKGTLQQRVDSLALEKHWIYFLNAESGITVEAVKTEAENYTSKLGHSAMFFGHVIYAGKPTDKEKNEEGLTDTDTKDRECPLSAIAAAIAVEATVAEGASQAPAGTAYPVVNPGAIPEYVGSDTDFTTLKNAGVNTLKRIGKFGYCIWGARTLAEEQRFLFINTRQCINTVARQLEDALTPYLLEPIDPRGRTTSEVVMISTSIMEAAYENNYLTGNSPAEAYQIIQFPIENSVVKIQIIGNFVNSIEQIEITLVNGEIQ